MEVMSEIEGREERWIKYYSSDHTILLVGEGDFSFSLCLAMAFGSATNIVATTLDSYDELIKKYKNAKANLAILERLGASLLHGVDVTKMKIRPDLQCRKFHRIIYNFPHAGFYGKEDDLMVIMLHRELVHGFLCNASKMLYLDGEIHVNHKSNNPYNQWRIEDLASYCSLFFVGSAAFSIKDYPGYKNKRGSGPDCDQTFNLGACRTFKFKLNPAPEKILHKGSNLYLMHNTSPTFQDIHFQVQHMPILFDRQSPMHPVSFLDSYLLTGPTPHVKHTNECHQVFGGYLNHVEETFGSFNDVHQSVQNALSVGYTTYNVVFPGRSFSGYIDVLEELRHLSIRRSQRLRQMLVCVDQQLRASGCGI